MILIADSGSTKTDWALVQSDCSFKNLSTSGINPVTQSEEQILEIIKSEVLTSTAKVTESADVSVFTAVINQIFFYGAGCSSAERCALISSALKSSFEKAEIH